MEQKQTEAGNNVV